MECVKIVTDDRGQSIQLPEACRFAEDEILVERVGDAVLLIPLDARRRAVLEALDMFTDDFLAEEIEDPPPQDGPGLGD